MQVVNNVVKLEDWDTSMWLEVGGGKKKTPTFVMAGKSYQSSTGESYDVMFRSVYAFMWVDNRGKENQDVWKFSEVAEWWRSAKDYDFPEGYRQLCSLTDISGVVNMAALQEFGLDAYAEDIKAHLDDVMPYCCEREA